MDFNKNKSLTLYFCEIFEINDSIYVKYPLRLSALLNFENDDK